MKPRHVDPGSRVVDPVSRTVALASMNVEHGGRPFACVIVRGNTLVAESANLVEQTHDPTAHAEILAIREACLRVGSENLEGCEIYVLAHPCPMCLGALYYCSPDRVIFLTTREEYSNYYSDHRRYFAVNDFYAEFAAQWPDRRLPMVHVPRREALDVFARWQAINS